MTAKDLKIKFDGEMAARVERVAARLHLSLEDLCEFSIVKAVEDMEHLARVCLDTYLREQLRDVLDLRKLGVLPQADFEREVEELLGLPDDDQWTNEVD